MSVFVQTDSNYFEMECWRDGIMENWRNVATELCCNYTGSEMYSTMSGFARF